MKKVISRIGFVVGVTMMFSGAIVGVVAMHVSDHCLLNIGWAAMILGLGATVVLTDGTECYCDQAIARDLRDAIDGVNDKEFEIWTNNDNEHEIVCIN